MTDLITHQDIISLTGYEQYAKQCEVLTNHGVFFIRDKNGCPHTTWYNFNHPTHLRFNNDKVHNDEPDFSAFG